MDELYMGLNELYHHGVKGQKWGERRYQNTDGSYKPNAVGRYNDDGKDGVNENNRTNILERHKNKLIESYKAKGYGPEAAEVAAKRRMKTEVFVGATATVAIAVVATKVAKRIGEDYVDKTIKSGKVIQNIGAYKDAAFKDDPFFAAINNHDKKAYASLYPSEKKGMQAMIGGPTDIYKNQIKIKQDVKVASVNNAKKIFENKMKSDANFRKEVMDTLEKTDYGKIGAKEIANYKNSGKVSKKLYDRFNQALATPEMQKAGVHKKFYSELQKNGYDAILDINDTRYSGYKNISKSPTIFFGNDKLEKIGSTKLSDAEINKNAIKYGMSFALKQQGKQLAVLGAGMGVADAAKKQKLVNEYLKEHPNSKLSEQEIIDKMLTSDT